MASLFLPTTTRQQGEEASEGKKKWISFGLGKIFSSVFAFAGDDASSSDADSASDTEFHGDGGEDAAPADGASLPKTNQPQPAHANPMLTIHHLITQHTFTREESHNLIKLIESRVVQPSNLHAKQHDYVPFPPVQVSPEVRNMAIAESKKWLEDKKKTKTARSTSKTIDFGPSKLNTNNSHFETESDIGSPVDLAKSYMQSKPPWQSPFLASSSTLFTTPLTGSSKFSTSFIQGTFDHSLSSSRFLKRDYISSSMWDPKEESSRRLRPRLSESAYESISSFTRPGSNSRLFDRDVLDSHNNLNFSPVDGKEPSNAGLDIISSQAGTAETTVKNSEPTLENNVLLSQEVSDKEQRITEGTAVNLNEGTEGIVEVVNLETSDPTLPAYSEKNSAVEQDQKILTDEQPPLEGNKGGLEPENFADPKPHEGELHITNSLHGSTNKNSANCPAVPSNMESEFESSINGGPISITAGPDVSDGKSLNDSNAQTGLKTLEADKSPVRKGKKRVVSGRSRGRGKVKGRGT